MKIFVAAILCLTIALANAGWSGHGAGAVISGPGGTVATSGNGAWGGWGGWGGHGWNGWGNGWNGGAWNGAWGGHGGWDGGWAGSGHEGQWIPDHNEAHYDDGSYRPEHHWGGHGHGW